MSVRKILCEQKMIQHPEYKFMWCGNESLTLQCNNYKYCLNQNNEACQHVGCNERNGIPDSTVKIFVCHIYNVILHMSMPKHEGTCQ